MKCCSTFSDMCALCDNRASVISICVTSCISYLFVRKAVSSLHSDGVAYSIHLCVRLSEGSHSYAVGSRPLWPCRVRRGLQFWAEHEVEPLPSVPVTLYLMPQTKKIKDKISYYYFEVSNQWLKACFIFKWNLNQIVFLESEWRFAVWSTARGWCTMLPGWEQCHLGGPTAAGLAVRR